MAEYCTKHERHAARLSPEVPRRGPQRPRLPGALPDTLIIEFGPPTPGPLSVSLVAYEPVLDPDAPPAPPTDGRPIVEGVTEGTREGVMLRPAPQPPGLPPSYLPEEQFHIDIVDGSGSAVASSDGRLMFDVPEPQQPPRWVVFGGGPKWSAKVINRSSRVAQVSVNLYYRGQEPLLIRDINLDLLNEKLDLLLNSEQPFRIVFENRTPPGAIGLYLPATSVIRFVANPAWMLVYPDIAEIELDLCGRVFTEGTESNQILVRATVHDGALAFKLRVGFPPNRGRIDVIAAIEAGIECLIKPALRDLAPTAVLNPSVMTGAVTSAIGLAAIADALSDPVLSIEALSIEFFLVLRPRETSAQFELIARPDVRLRESGIPGLGSTQVNSLVNAALKWFFEQHLPNKYHLELRDAGISLLGWLLGDRFREVVGSVEKLALRYCGDPVWMNGLSRPLGALTPTPPLYTGNLAKIDHIVVVMMENRSFDHMLGFLTLPPQGNDGRVGYGRTEVSGLTGSETNPRIVRRGAREELEQVRVFSLSEQIPGTLTRGTLFPFDPGHNFSAALRQRGGYDVELRPPPRPPGEEEPPMRVHIGPNKGFVLDFVRRLAGRDDLSMESRRRHGGEVMGYHPAEHVPVYAFLATKFAACDHWFASHPGHTWPNRFATLTGRLAPGPDGRPQIDNPDPATFDPVEVDTIFDHLSRAGITWRYYEHDFSMLRTFARYTWDQERVLPVDNFYQDVRLGQLPAVTFIDPDITDAPPGNDDHAPSDIRLGQDLIARIYNALATSPQWPKVLLIITYDEHGGFYDHVPPLPQPIFDPSSSQGFAPLGFYPGGTTAINFFGMRVPTLIVSPWIPPAAVSNDEFDHTTILKTIMARFLPQQPPDMGLRVELARSLEPLLSLSTPRAAIPYVARGRGPSAPVWSGVRRSRPDDFGAFLTALRRRIRGA